jgi:myo-inositol-1(or 4)-monophosphatase
MQRNILKPLRPKQFNSRGLANMNMDLEKLCLEVAAIAKSVGEYIDKERINFSVDRVKEKGLHDLVSYVDQEAEKLIIKGLIPLIPEAGFITEEETLSKEGEEYNWIIDPLDGTTNFIHGIPTYSVSIALTFHGTLVVAVVYEINRMECFTAWKDGGAFLNGNPISVSNTRSLSSSLLATGFPFRSNDFLDEYLVVLKTMMQSTRGIRRIGSAAVDLAYVACGRFDCFFEFNLKNYDMAAGILLIKEAGGKAIDFLGGGNMLEKGSVIAGNPMMTDLVYTEIKKSFS